MSSAQERYKELEKKRTPFLRRARVCSALTIPSLITPEGHNETSDLYEPWQDIGAEIVTALASKTTTALYPPGQPSFRLSITPRKLIESGQMSPAADIEQGLTLTESLMETEIESKGWRSHTNIALQHLIVSGNVGELMLTDNRLKLFRLDQYVVVRDPAGEMVEFVIREQFSPNNLPENIRELAGESDGTALIDLYTWGKRDGSVWTIHQEVADKPVENSKGRYTICPFSALRWTAVAGEDYGRSKVEDHLPSLRKLEVLEQGVTEGTALSTRHVGMVKPGSAGGLRLRRRLAKANNGDFVVGDFDSVGTFEFGNITGLEVADRRIDRIEQRLRAAFLMNSSVQRDAERVTAYEFQKLTEELEGALGGVYSLLAFDLQQHRVRRLMKQMIHQEALPQLDDDDISPTILTGLAALGRQGDVGNVIQAVNLLQPLGETVAGYIKPDVLLKKGLNGLDLADAVRTEEEYLAFQQQQAQAQAAQAVLQAGGEAAAQGLAQNATTPQQ